jgi:Family of unknown function (DUF6807)
MKSRSFMNVCAVGMLALLAAVLCSVSYGGVLVKMKVAAGEYERIDTPVSVSSEAFTRISRSGELFRLEEITDKGRIAVPFQIDSASIPTVSWILSGKTKAKQTRRFELVSGKEPVVGSRITIDCDGKRLDIIQGGEKVLRYHHAVMPPPKGVSAKYNRSAFIHPLWSPAGDVLTRIHAKDHYHHMGLWNPWTHTEFEGRKVDFWNLGDGKGTVRFVKFAEKISGSVYGGFRAIQEHVDLSAPGGEKVALIEQFDVRAWNVKEGCWLLDYTTTQRCASDSPLFLPKYRYGGFGFRATGKWNGTNSNYLTSEGKDRKTGHATRSRWCLVYGAVDSGSAGILFMSHTGNHQHPEPMRIWPSEKHVFFNYCPIQKQDWTLEPGNDYVLKYRLCVYNGDMKPKVAERYWRDFVNPPKITLE